MTLSDAYPRLKVLLDIPGAQFIRRTADVDYILLLSGLEICNEDGTFDVWSSEGAPVKFNLTEDEVRVYIEEQS